MKKVLLLLLALTLCLCAAACGDGGKVVPIPEETDVQPVNRWIGQNNSDGPYYIDIAADGTCVFSTGEEYVWEVLEAPIPELLSLKVKQGDTPVYEFQFQINGKGVTSLYVLTYAEDPTQSDQIADYKTVLHTSDHPDFDKLVGSWVPSDADNADAKEVTISKDGKCTIGDAKLEWSAYHRDNDMDFQVFAYDATGLQYIITVQNLDDGESGLWLVCKTDGTYFGCSRK